MSSNLPLKHYCLVNSANRVCLVTSHSPPPPLPQPPPGCVDPSQDNLDLLYLCLSLVVLLVAMIYTRYCRYIRAPDAPCDIDLDHANYPPTMSSTSTSEYRLNFQRRLKQSKEIPQADKEKNLKKASSNKMPSGGNPRGTPKNTAVGSKCTSTTEYENIQSPRRAGKVGPNEEANAKLGSAVNTGSVSEQEAKLC